MRDDENTLIMNPHNESLLGYNMNKKQLDGKGTKFTILDNLRYENDYEVIPASGCGEIPPHGPKVCLS